MDNPSTNILYDGKPDPHPAPIPLRAGPLTMIYENGDLRYLKWGRHEIVRRLYVAIRDRNWNTAVNVLSDVQIESMGDQFRISYRCTNRLADIDLVWQGMLVGTADGTITCTMRGEALSTFQRNRIGFCLLHPSTIAGAKGRITHVNGSTEEHSFPLHIAQQLIVDGIIKPVAPFAEMRAVAHEVVPGVWAEVAFAGEIFEMEDQRNWTDASYKTYGTPLRLPFPVTVVAGTRIEQQVTIRIDDQGTRNTAQQLADVSAPITVAVGQNRSTLPQIGLGVASHGEPLREEEYARLRALNLAHLRVDLHLAEEGHGERLEQATREAQRLEIPLELALHLTDNADRELALLAGNLDIIKPAVARWLIFTNHAKTTTAPWVQLARKHLGAYAPAAPIGAGTNVYFTELNSRRPPVEALDVVAYSINPQVHAFDNSSLVETLAAQATTATSARQFCGDLPLVVSPITLQPRFNPNATGPEPAPPPGELPPQVDPRQLSLFGAGWTLGSIKYLAETGEVASLTYYETSGWRGVMERAQGSPLPEKFPSIPGAVFPLYHVLADVGEFAGGTVIACQSSAPLQVAALLLEKANRRRLLLANFTSQPQQVMLEGMAGTAVIRTLDEQNVLAAMQNPEAFRILKQEQTVALPATVTLRPYGLFRCDLDSYPS
ncbi:MAG TPA: hypothetical protein P5121_16115 [Caldilineaceae bacterium]|nr:hypothetical protein [Caldilineaceae bacterium]